MCSPGRTFTGTQEQFWPAALPVTHTGYWVLTGVERRFAECNSITLTTELPGLRTKFGERAFSRAGPSAWNRLPEDIRAEPNIANFRKLLKTHYYNSVFTVQ